MWYLFFIINFFHNYITLAYQRYKRETIDSIGKVVIINLTSDLSEEQNVLMNLFFSANQNSLEVSVAALNNGVVPILQQACDITSGTHMIATSDNLLQYLMVEFILQIYDGKIIFFSRGIVSFRQ